MVFMTDFGADSTYTNTVIHLAGMAVVPMLIHEVFLSDGERTKLIAQRVLILINKKVFH